MQPLCPQAVFGRTTDCVARLGAGTCSGTASDACARSARSAKLPTRVSKVARRMKADSHHHPGPGPALRGSDGSGVPGAAGRQRHRHALDGRAVNSLNEGCTSGSGPEAGPRADLLGMGEMRSLVTAANLRPTTTQPSRRLPRRKAASPAGGTSSHGNQSSEETAHCARKNRAQRRARRQRRPEAGPPVPLGREGGAPA